jgi:hypothetical protein
LLRRAKVLTNLKPTRSTRLGERVEVRRSPKPWHERQEIRRRTWEAPALRAVGRSKGGYIGTKARKGKPGHRVKREPQRWAGKPCGKAEEYCERESPPDVPGESYQLARRTPTNASQCPAAWMSGGGGCLCEGFCLVSRKRVQLRNEGSGKTVRRGLCGSAGQPASLPRRLLRENRWTYMSYLTTRGPR